MCLVLLCELYMYVPRSFILVCFRATHDKIYPSPYVPSFAVMTVRLGGMLGRLSLYFLVARNDLYLIDALMTWLNTNQCMCSLSLKTRAFVLANDTVDPFSRSTSLRQYFVSSSQ